jgi:hypothetical protein
MKEAKSVTKNHICGMTVDKAMALCAECDRETFSAVGVLPKSMVGFHPIAKLPPPAQYECWHPCKSW